MFYQNLWLYMIDLNINFQCRCHCQWLLISDLESTCLVYVFPWEDFSRYVVLQTPEFLCYQIQLLTNYFWVEEYYHLFTTRSLMVICDAIKRNESYVGTYQISLFLFIYFCCCFVLFCFFFVYLVKQSESFGWLKTPWKSDLGFQRYL